jgi:hypothetical protein
MDFQDNLVSRRGVENCRNVLPLLRAGAASGARLVTLQVSDGENPWLKMSGMYKDDPLFDKWQQAIADYRRQIEEDPEIP